MQDVDAFLLGRRTYVTHAEAFEPMPKGDLFGLVDDLHLTLYPLALGSGKRALPEGVSTKFNLVSATPYPTGVVGLHYARKR